MADKLLHLCLHGGERNVLRRLHRTHDASRVLLRKEALGNDDVEIDAERGRPDRDQQGQRLVAQNQLQRAAVELEGGVKDLFAEAIDAAVLFLVRRTQEFRAHHRSDGERDDAAKLRWPRSA